jgi:hypothetical protein
MMRRARPAPLPAAYGLLPRSSPEPSPVKRARPSALAAQGGAGFGLAGETGIAARLLPLDLFPPFLLLRFHLAPGAFFGPAIRLAAFVRSQLRKAKD